MDLGSLIPVNVDSVKNAYEKGRDHVIDFGSAAKDWAADEARSMVRVGRMPQTAAKNIGAPQFVQEILTPPVERIPGYKNTQLYKDTDPNDQSTGQNAFDVFNSALNIASLGAGDAAWQAGKTLVKEIKPLAKPAKELAATVGRSTKERASSLLDLARKQRYVKEQKKVPLDEVVRRARSHDPYAKAVSDKVTLPEILDAYGKKHARVKLAKEGRKEAWNKTVQVFRRTRSDIKPAVKNMAHSVLDATFDSQAWKQGANPMANRLTFRYSPCRKR